MKYTKGQKVYVIGYSGFCDPSWKEITDIQIRYDELTGKEYQLIICDNMHFRGDTGECVKGASAYYIDKS